MRLIRGIWGFLIGVKDALVLVFMLMFFGLLYAALSMAPGGQVKAVGTGALVLDLDGTIVEQPANVDPLALLSGSGQMTAEYRLRDLVNALRAAARDPAVKVVVLDLDRFMGGGQAAIADAGAAIDEARRAGKPVLAFATGYLDDGYQLAAHASEVWLDPVGAVMIAGPGGSHLYYKGFLDKIGVTANVYRVGTFKSAVEPFTRSDQSPEARAASRMLVDALWGDWKASVAKVRPNARVEAYVANPEGFIRAADGSIAQAAVAAGLVDRLGDRLAFEQRVASLAGEAGKGAGYRRIDLARYMQRHPEPVGGTPIGVLTVAGEIVDGEAGPGTAAGDTIADLLTRELARNRIKALVVRVDSPGGSVTAAERIRSAILAAKARGLPVVVSMGTVAASGGYWIATPADRILASPSTITGSIGVFGIIPSFEGTLAKLGLGADGVKATPLSGEPDLLRGTSPEFDRLVQLGVEDIYRRFVGMVAESRRLSPERVDQLAQGRVWPAIAAQRVGLVDGFGSLDVAIAEAAKLAKVDPAKATPLFIEKELNPFEKWLREASQTRGGDEGQGGDAWSFMAGRPDRVAARALRDAQHLLAGPVMQVRCLECGGLASSSSSSVPAPARGGYAWLPRLIETKFGL